MKTKIIAIGCAFALSSLNAFAQLVSVECCVDDAEIARIGECLSGPGETQLPPGCESVSTCVLGFGGAVLTSNLVSGFCDPTSPDLPDFSPGEGCSFWRNDTTPMTQQCVAAADETNLNLLLMFDSDEDKDLDMRDVASFQREFLPILPIRPICALPPLVSVECWVSEEDLLGICDCVSGPGNTQPPQECRAAGTCVLGFGETGPEPELPRCLCDPAAPPIPDDTGSFISFWLDDTTSATQYCVAAPESSLNFHLMFDADGDGDLDAEDLAFFEIDCGPTSPE